MPATRPFRIDDPYNGRLSISARPRGGDWLEDEVGTWREILGRGGVIVSLLSPDEEESLALESEGRYCQDNGLQFRSFPIVDRSIPSSDVDAINLIAELDGELRQGKHVLLHCRQGVGRSGMIAAGILIKNGLSPEEAMRRWTQVRGTQVPETLEQMDWLKKLPALLSTASPLRVP
jgi:protein-tyrosine phosphatase